MAAYFSNLPLYTYPPDRPLPLPAFYFGHAAVLGPAELETLRLTHPVDVQPLDRTQVARAVREQNLDDLWSASSALELMLVSGLLSEAAWLARNLGDWKNAFLLSFADGVLQEPDVPADVLTSFPRNPDCLKPETLALSKLGPVLWDEFCKEVSGDREPALRRKWSFQSLQDPDEQEVHLDSRSVGAVARVVQASLVAGLDLVPVILAGLVDALRAAVGRLEWVVPAGFYLPAPPLYCPQPPDEKKVSCGHYCHYHYYHHHCHRRHHDHDHHHHHHPIASAITSIVVVTIIIIIRIIMTIIIINIIIPSP